MDAMQVFGDYENLVGWYCSSAQECQHNTAVVMLTPGMLHHVGPMRLHVQLARQLARMEIPSFRFDLSGIGESLAVATQGCSLERATQEVRQALDWLEEHHGLREFILFGLCSGADDALVAALSEPRVIGLSLMDGCGFRTKQFHWHRFWYKHWNKARTFHKWIALAKSQVGLSKIPSEYSSLFNDDIREFASREVCQTQIEELLARRVQMQWIYTGGAIDYYSYQQQFFDMFPRLIPSQQLEIHHYPFMDHLATLREDRNLLLKSICDWCRQVVSTRDFADSLDYELAKSSVNSTTKIQEKLDAVLS